SRGLILAVITLPFSVPVLIFGTLAVQASASGLPTGGYLTLLLAILAASLSLAPLTSAAALRISVS
ncbi:heme exporter protein CcmB, partial [Gammaproteobacteria bacterium]|nr:heme exporter protein CcmB [Gammaproteobacteria bacterium]